MRFSTQIVLLTLFSWVVANDVTGPSTPYPTITLRKRTFTFTWEGPTEPLSEEDLDGMLEVSLELLFHYACNLTKEVLVDLETTFLAEVAEKFQQIKKKNKMKWSYKFENILSNCQLVIDVDKEDIDDRLIAIRDNDEPDLKSTPFRPASISNLIHNFNHMMILLREDEELKDVEAEKRRIRRLLDDAEAELHRCNFRVRTIMKRIARRFLSMDNNTQTTPLSSSC